jgi:hypothetical protein
VGYADELDALSSDDLARLARAARHYVACVVEPGVMPDDLLRRELVRWDRAIRRARTLAVMLAGEERTEVDP